LEAEDTVGGGLRSRELTRSGFVHDVCSTIHAFGNASLFFRSLPLSQHGLEWVHPPAPLAHPFDDGSAATLARSLEATCRGLGVDGRAYEKLMGPLVARSQELFDEVLGPFRLPRHPILMSRFGLRAMRSARGLVRSWFKEEKARALFAGLAGHS